MKKLIWLAVIVSAVSYAKLLPDESNNIEVYKKSNPSVVNITSVTLQRDFFFELIPQKGVGSGMIIRPDGYILTNHHVVGEAAKLEVTLFDKSTFPAEVVGLDPDTDLAVIRIKPGEKKLVALEYGDAGELQVGQKVMAIGNPFGLGGSLSVGIISSLGRDIRTPTDRLIKDVIQTDAAINPGNSGGPLLDSSGKLIGVNAQIVTTSGGSEGVGFAISVKTARKIAEQLIRFGRVRRPDLGLYGVGLSRGLLDALRVPITYGVMVTEVTEGGPAQKVGIRAADREAIFGFRRIPFGGDIIFRIDEARVETLRDLFDYIFEKKDGDTVVLHFFRGSTRKKATVRLAIPSIAGAGTGRGM